MGEWGAFFLQHASEEKAFWKGENKHFSSKYCIYRVGSMCPGSSKSPKTCEGWVHMLFLILTSLVLCNQYTQPNDKMLHGALRRDLKISDLTVSITAVGLEELRAAAQSFNDRARTRVWVPQVTVQCLIHWTTNQVA